MKRDKKIVTLFVACVLFVSCLGSIKQEAFDRANTLYEQKEYKKALQLYDSIGKKGPVTFYNMGNSAFSLGKYADAIIYWRKAFKSCALQDRTDIIYNIAVAYAKLGDASTQTFWSNMATSINTLSSSLISFFWLQVLFLFLWFAFFISWFWLARYRILMLVILIFFNVFIASTLLIRYRFLQYPIAIVKKSATLFAGPDSNYHKIGDVKPAEKVRVKGKVRGWYKAKTNGLVGWIKSEKIEII